MGIEVYVVLLLLATPIFFFWRWLYRKKVSSRLKRNILIAVSTIITTPVLYIGGIFLFFYFLSWYPNKDFDRAAWMNDKDKRYELSHDIIKSKMLIGKTKPQVRALLGEGNNNPDDVWYYDLGFVPEVFNIDPEVLMIIFKDGKVIEVSQHTT